MTPTLTFFFGLLLLVLFGWYFATDFESRKRWLGLILTILLTAFCVEQMTPLKEKIRLGLDLQGGTSFLIRLIPSKDQEITPDMQQQAVEVIRKRVDEFGGGEPVITPQGRENILVQIAGLNPEQIEETKKQLQRVAKLDFARVYPNSDQMIAAIEAGTANIDPNYQILPYVIKNAKGETHTTQLLVRKRPDMTGDHVTSAHPFFDQQGYGVALNLDSTGAELFGKLTDDVYKNHTQLAILLDGEIQSAPGVTQGPIYGGRATITGNFTELESRNLASILENPLKVPVEILETRSVSSSLGAASIRSGILASVSGLALVVIFMVLYYRIVGFVAIIALLINCIMVLGAMAMFGSVLTLPGIAGIILGIGIAVDANVLIYERLREELEAGVSLKAAIDKSYRKAFSAIFDAHVTQILTSAILFYFATGPVRGFALTLTIGIIASMFSSLLVTHVCFSWAFRFNLLKKVTMLHLIKSNRFDFLGKGKPFAIISLILVIASIAFFAVRGSHNFGVDFKGGDLLVLSSKEHVTPDQIRDVLNPTLSSPPVVQAEKSVEQDLIAIRSDAGSSATIKDRLLEALPNAGITFEQDDHVGALVGSELATKSAIAILLGMVGIFIYVSLRFETSFAVASLIALAHDLIITLGIYSLVGRELSLIMVGAFLTIAGYSINDKIVVFDRIRGALRSGTSGSIRQVMNTAINETLSRTILTGGTVLLTVLALYFFGGSVLNDFAFALLIGVLIGTYSSIFIAAPIVLWWSQWSKKSIRREVLESQATA